MALRVSCEVTPLGLSELSIRPAKRSFRCRSKTKACGVATGPYALETFCFSPSYRNGKVKPRSLADLQVLKAVAQVAVAEFIQSYRLGIVGRDGHQAGFLSL